VNPILVATLRRSWRMTGAIAAFLVFTVIHFLYFRPAAERYRKALSNVGGIEAVFNPSGQRPVLPPRVFALIAQHSLAPQDAIDRGNSGALGVVLLEELGRVATRAGLRVESSEPGPVVQQPLSLQVRAQLRLRGRYSAIVSFFDELARVKSLMMVDHFQITALESGEDQLEVSISRLYLKRATGTP